MILARRLMELVLAGTVLAGLFLAQATSTADERPTSGPSRGAVIVHPAMRFDVSPPLALLGQSSARMDVVPCQAADCGTAPPPAGTGQEPEKDSGTVPPPEIPAAAAGIEQTAPGKRAAVTLDESFDGLGSGFEGPQGTASFRNPSDNSLAVGPNHIVQIVNVRLAVYTKKGGTYPESGKVLYGPVATNAIFTGFGGPCEAHPNGDGVVRYDQLAGRWLIVMPLFAPLRPEELAKPAETGSAQLAGPGQLAKPGQASSPGPPTAPPGNPAPPKPPVRIRRPGVRPGEAVETPKGTFGMCYAVSTGPDPLGTYYRYAFERSLFPDYPRPAVWPDGYYLPTSTGDTVIQKHVCIANRNKMLAGQPATEQCLVIDGVNFLNNADVDGQNVPPRGAPNIMMAAGGTQLKKIFEDDGIYAWKVHVDWNNSANTKAEGPVKIPVAPYHYLCNGQLTHCVTQPGTDVRLDVQGDKLMQRLVYRKIGRRESIVAVHSIYTKAGGGGVRWYEFRLDKRRNPYLYQEGTYAPDGFYRFLPSADTDRNGDIGIGYSFGGVPNFPGQRFAGRLAKDPKGLLTFEETVLAEGQASQTDGFRWEDYTTTAVDPSDDCTFWYVGDYLRQGDKDYRTRLGAFRLPGCEPRK
jgi:hypothetical protein